MLEEVILNTLSTPWHPSRVRMEKQSSLNGHSHIVHVSKEKGPTVPRTEAKKDHKRSISLSR